LDFIPDDAFIETELMPMLAQLFGPDATVQLVAVQHRISCMVCGAWKWVDEPPPDDALVFCPEHSVTL
jgi:hypothetical protein